MFGLCFFFGGGGGLRILNPLLILAHGELFSNKVVIFMWTQINLDFLFLLGALLMQPYRVIWGFALTQP